MAISKRRKRWIDAAASYGKRALVPLKEISEKVGKQVDIVSSFVFDGDGIIGRYLLRGSGRLVSLGCYNQDDMEHSVFMGSLGFLESIKPRGAGADFVPELAQVDPADVLLPLIENGMSGKEIVDLICKQLDAIANQVKMKKQ